MHVDEPFTRGQWKKGEREREHDEGKEGGGEGREKDTNTLSLFFCPFLSSPFCFRVSLAPPPPPLPSALFFPQIPLFEKSHSSFS